MVLRNVADVRPTRVEVDLGALAHNVTVLHRAIATPIWAVVKADGYGHGAIEVAQALQSHPGICGFAVSLVEEGVALRAAGIVAPILVLGPAQHGGEAAMIEHALMPAISDVSALLPLAAAAAAANAVAPLHLKIDTGMGRLGIAPVAAPAAIDQVMKHPHLQLAGIMTHFANADIDDPADPSCATALQLAAFETPVRAAKRAAPSIMVHAANSSGAMLFDASRFDAVRLGLALYGNGQWSAAGSSSGASSSARKGAMRLVTQVVQLRDLPPGHAVGYGQTWRAERPTRVAVLPLGYADGYPRSMSGTSTALIAGRRVPLIGTVSMDMVVADVTDVANVGIGDDVVLLGSDKTGAQITTAEFATWSGLTEYEVTCGISKRVPRVYTGP